MLGSLLLGHLTTFSVIGTNELGGKSGSSFYFSHDQRFMIKAIKQSESKFLQMDFLPKYSEFMTRHTSKVRFLILQLPIDVLII
jgi:hypothetical protein